MVGFLKHVNILTNSHSFLANFLCKQFRLSEKWTKSTANGVHTAFECGTSQLVVSQSSSRKNAHNKLFILTDLYSNQLQIESCKSSVYARLNSVANLVFTAPYNYSGRLLNPSSRWSSESGINYTLFDTPCQGLSYLYEESKASSNILSHRDLGTSANVGMCPYTNLDHVLLAVERGKMQSFVDFHVNNLGFERVLVSANESEEAGMLVEIQEGEGLRMKAMHVTKCADLALVERNLKTKIILADSLSSQGSHDQISQFIRNNGQHSGVQHISLHTDDIVSTCEDLRLRGVKFLQVPSWYYQDREWRCNVERLGVDPDLLEQQNLLFDYDADSENPSYLLQIFTEPIFPNEATLFLEIIQRSGGIQGFGENNIKSLWRAVKGDKRQRTINMRSQ